MDFLTKLKKSMTEDILYVVVTVVTFCYLQIKLLYWVHVGMNNLKEIIGEKKLKISQLYHRHRY